MLVPGRAGDGEGGRGPHLSRSEGARETKVGPGVCLVHLNTVTEQLTLFSQESSTESEEQGEKGETQEDGGGERGRQTEAQREI